MIEFTYNYRLIKRTIRKLNVAELQLAKRISLWLQTFWLKLFSVFYLSFVYVFICTWRRNWLIFCFTLIRLFVLTRYSSSSALIFVLFHLILNLRSNMKRRLSIGQKQCMRMCNATLLYFSCFSFSFPFSLFSFFLLQFLFLLAVFDFSWRCFLEFGYFRPINYEFYIAYYYNGFVSNNALFHSSNQNYYWIQWKTVWQATTLVVKCAYH